MQEYPKALNTTLFCFLLSPPPNAVKLGGGGLGAPNFFFPNFNLKLGKKNNGARQNPL